jgi:hypothetical protein
VGLWPLKIFPPVCATGTPTVGTDKHRFIRVEDISAYKQSIFPSVLPETCTYNGRRTAVHLLIKIRTRRIRLRVKFALDFSVTAVIVPIGNRVHLDHLLWTVVNGGD